MKASENLPEPLLFIKAIHEAGVKYLLIGRQAVIAYGGPIQTMDYDIYIDGSEENTNKLLDIALDFGLTPNLPKEELRKTFKFKLENEIVVDVFRARTLSSPKTGKIEFSKLYENKVIAKDRSGLSINLPSIDDLILLKKLRSSPKDTLDIRYLEKIKQQSL
ncbi:MAG: hypothetical protein QME05_01615 [Candidatus Margulisbacteria bacterium]|nr:hypothetical protein [Candidatus Margulisiibacteriota bacterium]